MNIEYQKKPASQTQKQKKYPRRSRFQQIHATKEENSLLFDKRSPAARLRIAQRRLQEAISDREDKSIYSNLSVPCERKQEPSKDYYIYINLETITVDSLFTKKIVASENILDESEPQVFKKYQTINNLRRKIPLQLQELPVLYGHSPDNGYALLKKFHKERRQRYIRWRNMEETYYGDEKDSVQDHKKNIKRTTVPIDPKLAQGLPTKEEMLIRKAKVLWRQKIESEGKILQVSPFRARRELAKWKEEYPQGLDAFKRWYNAYEQRDFRNWIEEKEQEQPIIGDIKSMTFKDGVVMKEYH
jgi:hypothetical protein